MQRLDRCICMRPWLKFQLKGLVQTTLFYPLPLEQIQGETILALQKQQKIAMSAHAMTDLICCYNSQNLVKCLKMSAEIAEKRVHYKQFSEQFGMCLKVAG